VAVAGKPRGREAVSTVSRSRENFLEESGRQPVGQAELLISFELLSDQATAPTSMFLWRQVRQVGSPPTSTSRAAWTGVSMAVIRELAPRAGSWAPQRSPRCCVLPGQIEHVGGPSSGCFRPPGSP